MRVPRMAGLRLDLGKTSARGRIWDADEVIAPRALNLPTGVTRVAFERLVAVGAVEFEFVCGHSLHPCMREAAGKSM
jgi:hypothetical protein